MKKRSILKIILLAVVLIVILSIISIFIFRKNKKDVKVYSVNDLMMENYWENSTRSEGMVTENKMQAVYLSSTQQIDKIAVTEGQHVKKGAVLLKYSTTLSNIEIERKEIDLKKLELDLSNAQKELDKIRTYQPGVPIWGAKPEQQVSKSEPKNNLEKIANLPKPEPEVEEEISPAPLTGNGSLENPYIFLWVDNKEYDSSFIDSLIKRAGDGKTEVVALFMVRENNSYEGNFKKGTKIKFSKNDSGNSFNILEVFSEGEDPLNPNIDDDIVDEPLPEIGPSYTATEIQKMIIDKEKEINEISLNIKVTRNEYNALKKELNNTTVYSKYDGIVKTVLSLDDEEVNSKPIIVVSGGGGYHIQGQVGELDLDKIKIGQEVNVQSYETGTFATGKIIKISEYPLTSSYYGGMGNTNVSYYPYIVEVSDEESFRENEYVSLTISQEENNSSSFYLLGAFIVNENGKNYSYVSGENNKLEKRELEIGKNMQGMIEIKSGISTNDHIAFPYGKDIKEGAQTIESSVEDLYMGY